MVQGQSLDVGFVFVDYEDKSLYQLRQWLQPLERLQSRFSVKVFYTSPDVAKELEPSSIEGVYFEGQNELTDRLYELSPKVLLYPNQNVRNFYALRYSEAVHVFVSHGESDKAYMSQNTIKRYDLYFAAGKAAIDRISSKVAHYDSSKRIVKIGRPQSLDSYSLPEGFVQSQKKKVLYAPTWEGVTKATRYTSIVSHGAKLVQALVDSGEYQVTYRPHPLSGTRDVKVKNANEVIKKIIRQAARPESSGSKQSPPHYIDESPFGWHLGYHDLMISDISAIAYDWLSTGNPIILTKPIEKKASLQDFPLIAKLYSITTEDLNSIQDIIANQFREGSDQKNVSSVLNNHYFRQPISQSDEYFADAISRAMVMSSELRSPGKFPVLSTYQSRGSALGLLRYPNFALREGLRLTGTWSNTRQLEKIDSAERLWVHLSDPFSGRSVAPSLYAALGSHQPGEKFVVVSNQVTSWLQIKKLLRSPEFVGIRQDVVVVPVANATDCELVVEKLGPIEARYLKHHPLNHMLLRLNNLEHTLWAPELDPYFSPDHSLVTYDKVFSPGEKTKELVDNLLDVSSPDLIEG